MSAIICDYMNLEYILQNLMEFKLLNLIGLIFHFFISFLLCSSNRLPLLRLIKLFCE